jgi:aminotransferase
MNIEEKINRTVYDMPPSGIRKFFDIVSEMKEAISLGVGEPDFITPWNIREAAIRSLEKGKTHYTSNWGIMELRKYISLYLKERFSTAYDPADVVVTVGASEALDLAFRAILERGDEVLIPAPSYVSYSPGVAFAGGVPIPISARAENDFRITPDDIKKLITPKTKAIMIPFPNNPTGTVMRKNDLEAIAKVIEKTEILVISDEIYAELTYGEKHVSIASIPGMYARTIVINGFSKAFAMTGWRLGYAAGPRPIIEAMVKIHQYSMLCAPIMSQMAGIEAIREGLDTGFRQVEEMRKSYDRRRKLIVNEFNNMGLTCFEPMGAFYVFPCIKSTGMTSEQFCEDLLHQKLVATVPGTAFGEAGEGFIRCSYAYSVANINEATKRIREYLAER